MISNNSRLRDYSLPFGSSLLWFKTLWQSRTIVKNNYVPFGILIMNMQINKINDLLFLFVFFRLGQFYKLINLAFRIANSSAVTFRINLFRFVVINKNTGTLVLLVIRPLARSSLKILISKSLVAYLLIFIKRNICCTVEIPLKINVFKISETRSSLLNIFCSGVGSCIHRLHQLHQRDIHQRRSLDMCAIFRTISGAGSTVSGFSDCTGEVSEFSFFFVVE